LGNGNEEGDELNTSASHSTLSRKSLLWLISLGMGSDHKITVSQQRTGLLGNNGGRGRQFLEVSRIRTHNGQVKVD
jgi:hypothetical protein